MNNNDPHNPGTGSNAPSVAGGGADRFNRDRIDTSKPPPRQRMVAGIVLTGLLAAVAMSTFSPFGVKNGQKTVPGKKPGAGGPTKSATIKPAPTTRPAATKTPPPLTKVAPSVHKTVRRTVGAEAKRIAKSKVKTPNPLTGAQIKQAAQEALKKIYTQAAKHSVAPAAYEPRAIKLAESGARDGSEEGAKYQRGEAVRRALEGMEKTPEATPGTAAPDAAATPKAVASPAAAS